MAKTASHVSDEEEVVCIERWVAMTKESPPPRIRATEGMVSLLVTGNLSSHRNVNEEAVPPRFVM
jgi:hypothetical protein